MVKRPSPPAPIAAADRALAPFGMPDFVARLQVEADARAGSLVNRDFAPPAAARTRDRSDAADATSTVGISSKNRDFGCANVLPNSERRIA